MTSKDLKALGLPEYEEIQKAFKETDHYNYCHGTGEEFTDGAEWMRGIAIDAIKKKEKEMIEKACEWLDKELPEWLVDSRVRPYLDERGIAEFRKALEE